MRFGRETPPSRTVIDDNPTPVTSYRYCRSRSASRSSTGARRSATSPESSTPPHAGSDPEKGDLIYYARSGNLGFYYNTAGVGLDDNVVHIGTYNATTEQLTQLEGSDVSVDIVG